MQERKTQYNPFAIKKRYDEIADLEDEAEKKGTFRVLIPRYLIKKYITQDDVVLDAAGGTGINAIFLALSCKNVTLVDLTPSILDRARTNIASKGLNDKIQVVEGDITDLVTFYDATFSFIVCVGAALSYVLDLRERAIQELLRVAKIGAIIIVQVQSKYGMMGNKIRKGLIKEAFEIHKNKQFTDGMGVRSLLYTVDEIVNLLREYGCQILETVTSPVFTQASGNEYYRKNSEELKMLETLEYEYCNKPELLGQGHHIAVVAKKIKPYRS